MTLSSEASDAAPPAPSRSARRPLVVLEAAALLVGLGAAASLLALGALVPERLGVEPCVREAFLGAAVAALAVFARAGGPAQRLLLLALALGALPFSLGPLADAAASLAGPEPEHAFRSLVLRASAAALAGALAGGPLGLVLGALARRPGRLRAALAAGALGLLVSPAPGVALAGAGLVLIAALLASSASEDLSEDSREKKAHPGRAIATIAVALAALALSASLPLIIRAATIGGELEARQLLSLSVAGAALGAAAARRLAHAEQGARALATAILSLVVAAATIAAAPRLLAASALVPALGLGLVAFFAGAAIAASTRGLAPGLVLAAILVPIGERAPAPLARAAWSKADCVWLALGASRERRREIHEQLSSGERVLRRFEVGASGLLAVVDSMASNARELVRDGRLLGSTPAIVGPAQSGAPLETRADLRTPLLAALLAETLGRDGGRVALLGFSDGLVARALSGRPGLSELLLVEDDASVLAVRDDPDDLFHGSWKESETRPVFEDARAFLRRSRGELDAVIDFEGALAREGALEVARSRLASGAALVRIVRAGPTFPEETSAFARVFPEALAFRPPRSLDVTILVGGVARIDSSRPAKLAGSDDSLARRAALAQLPVRNLAGTFVAGAEALSTARTPAELVATKGDIVRFLAAMGEKIEAPSLLDFAASETNPRVALAACALARDDRGESVLLCETEGGALYALGRDDEAVRSWKRALELDPLAITPRLDLATRHWNRGELDLARAVLKDGFSDDAQRNRPLNYFLGNIAFRQEHYGAATAYYDSALGFEKSTERSELSRKLFSEQTKAAQGKPQKEEDPRLLAEKARVLLDDCDRKEAKILARGETPSDQDVLYLRLQRQDARKWLEAAAKKLPEDLGILTDLGRARGAVGDLAGASAALEAAARLSPQSPRALFLLGEIMRGHGQLATALYAYERALARGSISSAQARTYLAIAEIQRDLGKPERAIRALEDAEQLDLGHPLVPANLAFLYAKDGRKKDALAAYARYQALIAQIGEPEDPALRSRLEAALRAP